MSVYSTIHIQNAPQRDVEKTVRAYMRSIGYEAIERRLSEPGRSEAKEIEAGRTFRSIAISPICRGWVSIVEDDGHASDVGMAAQLAEGLEQPTVWVRLDAVTETDLAVQFLSEEDYATVCAHKWELEEEMTTWEEALAWEDLNKGFRMEEFLERRGIEALEWSIELIGEGASEPADLGFIDGFRFTDFAVLHFRLKDEKRFRDRYVPKEGHSAYFE
ncbi:MAG: hypothetical protein HYY84_04865 [Deltaproteobacteria bacterium]|nr:hypothetical protein [Deltaproteobacteria bacterium]